MILLQESMTDTPSGFCIESKILEENMSTNLDKIKQNKGGLQHSTLSRVLFRQGDENCGVLGYHSFFRGRG